MKYIHVTQEVGLEHILPFYQVTQAADKWPFENQALSESLQRVD